MSLRSQLLDQIQIHDNIIASHSAEVRKLRDALSLIGDIDELGQDGRPLPVKALAQSQSSASKRVAEVVKAGPPQPRRKLPEAKPRPVRGKPSKLGSSRVLVMELLGTSPKDAMGSGDIARRLQSADLSFKSITNAVHYLKTMKRLTQIQREDGSYAYYRTPPAAPPATRNGVAASASTTA